MIKARHEMASGRFPGVIGRFAGLFLLGGFLLIRFGRWRMSRGNPGRTVAVSDRPLVSIHLGGLRIGRWPRREPTATSECEQGGQRNKTDDSHRAKDKENPRPNRHVLQTWLAGS